MLQDTNPDAACMYEIHEKDGEKAVKHNLIEIETKGKSTPTLCE